MQKVYSDMKQKSNYEIFKEDALKRFQTFDHNEIIDRLGLNADDQYIYVKYCNDLFRIHRKLPLMERMDKGSTKQEWREADTNEVLTICDLLCHTKKPIQLSDMFRSLERLNTVYGGTTQSTLAGGMLKAQAELFDNKDEILSKACESLGGVPCGKGDVAYEIPLFDPIHIRFSFYDSDEEFEPQMTWMFAENICQYLHYETLYYAVHTVVQRLGKQAGILGNSIAVDESVRCRSLYRKLR